MPILYIPCGGARAGARFAWTAVAQYIGRKERPDLPMEFEVDRDRGIIFVDVNDLEFDRFGELLDGIERLDDTRTLSLLVDRSNPMTDTFSWEQIRSGTDNSERLRDIFAGRKIAVVVPAGIRYGIARQIKVIAEQIDITGLRPFTDKREALRWLLNSDLD